MATTQHKILKQNHHGIDQLHVGEKKTNWGSVFYGSFVIKLDHVSAFFVTALTPLLEASTLFIISPIQCNYRSLSLFNFTVIN
jgi:hypothetical protein